MSDNTSELSIDSSHRLSYTQLGDSITLEHQVIDSMGLMIDRAKAILSLVLEYNIEDPQITALHAVSAELEDMRQLIISYDDVTGRFEHSSDEPVSNQNVDGH